MGNACARDYRDSSEAECGQAEELNSPKLSVQDKSGSIGRGGRGVGGADDNSTIALQMDEEEDLESADEEEDDEVDQLPLPSVNAIKRPRNSVSAEAYGEWNKKTDFIAPVYPKTEEQKKNIENVIADSSFLFSSLDKKELMTLIDAFEEKNIKKDVYIIRQGEDGDKLYLIEEGEVEVFKKLPGKDSEDFMCKMTKGDTFGELALMYNAPRAATVKAATDMHLWALDRETFNSIVKDSAAKKREIYDNYLREVSLLKDMDSYERSKISDALQKEMFLDGDVIIKEGEQGNTFYILVEGEAEAIKEDKVVMEYKKGDYFGELALIKNQPRAATVRAKGVCHVVSLNRKSFKRLLGPVEKYLMRNMQNYKLVCNKLGVDTSYLE